MTNIAKEVFVSAIQAIELQLEKDVKTSKKLGEVFIKAHSANLLPDNDVLFDALIKVLEAVMNDTNKWIQYYLYELDCGRENWRLKVKINNEDVPLSNASELYYLLIK